MAARQAKISRKTNETQIEVSIDLDGASNPSAAQVIDISTGIGFLDHVSIQWRPTTQSTTLIGTVCS